MEAGIGVGILLGPILGASLNQVGGYTCPFWTIGGVYLLMFPLIGTMLNRINNFGEIGQDDVDEDGYEPVVVEET